MRLKKALKNYVKKRPFLLRVVARTLRRFGFLHRPIRSGYDLYRSMLPDTGYHSWAAKNEEECFVEDTDDTKDTLISIVVPTFNTPQLHLLEMVYSVVNQHYKNWELLLVNASTSKERREAVLDCANIDTRIRVLEVEENKGIAGNTNVGTNAAQGKYIAFLDHDDKLHPCALHSAGDAIKNHNPDLIYTDEDKLDDAGALYFEPHCKPRWSPDLLTNVNYINHLTIIRTEYVRKVAGLRPAFDGAQDYDLLFRIIDECQPKIHHIGNILYHWRAAASSTAQDITNKAYIFDAGTKGISEHLQRNGVRGSVKVIKNKPGFYRIAYERPQKVSIVVGQVELHRQLICKWWITNIFKKLSKDNIKVEFIVGDWYKKYALNTPPHIHIRWVKETKNYWQEVADLISGDVVICFQAMATSAGKDDLYDLAATALHADVLAVAPVLIGPDKTILDAGFVEVEFGLQRLFKGYKLGQNTYFGTTDWTRNIMGLTMDVFAMKSVDFKELLGCAKTEHLTTFDLHAVYIRSKYTSMALLWAHTAQEYKGYLKISDTEDTYFNARLTQASAPMYMKLSTWGKTNERATE